MPYLGPVSDGGSAFFELNGNASYGDADLTVALPFTLECWAWIRESVSALQGFVAISNGTIAIELGISAGLQAHAFTPAGAIQAVAALSRQAWHHLVLTVTLGTCLLYADGVQVATGGSAATSYSPTLVIGSGGSAGSPTRFAHAALAECAIYSSALSLARVAAHFAAADTVSLRPVWRANGTFDITGSGGATSDVVDLTSVLKSVRKVY